MREPTDIAKTRSRCVMWLCGQCRAGAECRCLPHADTDRESPARPADREPPKSG